jgi:hypothetical protein
MTDIESGAGWLVDPDEPLECALIDEFLRAHGYDWDSLDALPDVEARRVLTEASVYAATKLAEVHSRARLIHSIHGEP